ncbi:MAG: sigma-70 family RNA polymerase sigma factor [Myxococcota bacterium]
MERALPATHARPSFDDVFKEHAPHVWRALRRLGVREADVADVAQEVFVVVHRKLRHFEGRSSLSTWIYGICIRRASQYRRKAWVRREVQTADPILPPLEAPQDRADEERHARVLLGRLLDTLDDDKREVFVLFEIERLPMNEIADILGVPVKTAYSRLYAARNAMKQALTTLEADR